MQLKLKESEIVFMELYSDPCALTECIMPENQKASHTWDEKECKCVRIRNYQHGMLNYSYIYANDSRKSPKENFNLKKISGTCFNIAARNLGKSYFLIIDVFLTLIHTIGSESLLASCDDTHLKKIATPVLNLCREHPFFRIFKKSGKIDGIKAQPIEIQTEQGHTLYGRNEKVDDPEPGVQFHSIHASTTWYEEFSYATKKGTEKRIDSVDSLGCIERLSGIPDIRVGSPLGDILYNTDNKKFTCRLPQFVRADWSTQTADEQALKYGGRNSMGYKLNVEAEPTEGAYGKWDMEKIRKCMVMDKRIKYFEIPKKLFEDLDNYPETQWRDLIGERLSKNLILSRLPCKKCIISSDIGTTGSQSEVCIFFLDHDNKWKYEYQISLFHLSIRQQSYVFEWLYYAIGGAFISLDCSNADGAAIRENLKLFKMPTGQRIPVDHLFEFKMQENMVVGVEVDADEKIILDNNRKPIEKELNTKHHAVANLVEIFDKLLVEIPYDEKFLMQFTAYCEIRLAAGKVTWKSSIDEHLLDSWLQFSLAAWATENKNLKKIEKKPRCPGVI